VKRCVLFDSGRAGPLSPTIKETLDRLDEYVWTSEVDGTLKLWNEDYDYSVAGCVVEGAALQGTGALAGVDYDGSRWRR